MARFCDMRTDAQSLRRAHVFACRTAWPKTYEIWNILEMRHEHGENEKIFSFQLLALAMG